MAKEADIEAYVRARVRPGRLLKWVSPGESGVPDRILILPEGQVVFIEFKKPGGRLSARQRLWMTRIESLGHKMRLISSMEEARAFIDELSSMQQGTQEDDVL